MTIASFLEGLEYYRKRTDAINDDYCVGLAKLFRDASPIQGFLSKDIIKAVGKKGF